MENSVEISIWPPYSSTGCKEVKSLFVSSFEFGEYLYEEILKAVPHRHFILSIPKILRRYFHYDRSLLSDPPASPELAMAGRSKSLRMGVFEGVFPGNIA